MSRGAAIACVLAAGAAARLAYAGLTGAQPGGEARWTRTNHRGEPVTLLEGPAVTAGAVGAVLVVPGLSARQRAALGLAGAAAGMCGCYDDLAGSSDRHGFRGHLGALARGEVTTGTVKIAGIGAAGLAGAVLLGQRGSGQSAGSGVRAADLVLNAGLIAGGANLLNLFDLRPGRAIKVALLGAAGLAAAGPLGRAAAAAPAGAAAALLPEDLGERAMLGDCGANALGAMLGAAAAASLRRPARLAGFCAIAGLTLASEKVSFTKIIARTPPLNWLDMLGRRPVPAAAAQTGQPPADAGSAPAPGRRVQHFPAGQAPASTSPGP